VERSAKPARLATGVLVATIASAYLLAPSVALAKTKTARPSILTVATYWEDARAQDADTPAGHVIAETPNEFCPSPVAGVGSPEQACAEGRLPVEVEGADYETPDKVSAVNFDLSTVLPGSKVKKFTVTFVEAEAGCYDRDGKPETKEQCEATDPINVDGQKLQACLVSETFGEGFAREYKEMPRHKCSNSDPVATRKQVKSFNPKDDASPDHVWTFDLTGYAQKWVRTASVASSILLFPVEPKQMGPGDAKWRVVLEGAQEAKGIQAKLVYEEADLPGFGTGSFDDFGGGETFSGGSGTGTVTTTTGTTSGTGGFSSGTGSAGVGTTTGGGGASPATGSGGGAPAEDLQEEAVPAAEVEPVGFPAYVWLALLAGMIGFSLVRSAVVESAAGVRPDGPLARIRELNAARRGTTLDAQDAFAGPMAAMLAALKFTAGSVGPAKKRLAAFTRPLKPAARKLADKARLLRR
jgi:hypothetical protein